MVNAKSWVEQNYYGKVVDIRLESTEELIENLLCPKCDENVTILDSANYGESAKHAGVLIAVTYECDKCKEVFEDGLYVSFEKVKNRNDKT